MANCCKKLFSVFFMLFFIARVTAQDITDPVVTGTVMTSKGDFLEDVTAKVKEVNGKVAAFL